MWFPVYALHHDLKYFPEFEKFHPERFSDENKNKSRVLSFTLLIKSVMCNSAICILIFPFYKRNICDDIYCSYTMTKLNLRW